MTAGRALRTPNPSRPVFLTLVSLYLLTAGGQGYSVDGTFSYSVARSVATDPTLGFVRQNAGTLRRWGVLMPLIGVPFIQFGSLVGRLAPPRDSVVVDGERFALRDWPPIGPPGADGAQREIVLLVPTGARASDAVSVKLVSFLSFATTLEEGQLVAEAQLLGGAGDLEILASAPIRAGKDTAEWSYDVPGVARPEHARASLAGHWPGNPEANLYSAALPLRTSGSPAVLRVRYVASEGRLYLRAAQIQGTSSSAVVPGPIAFGEDAQEAFFTRFGFSLLNASVTALMCALLVTLGLTLGYGPVPSAAIGLVTGSATFLWPHAKHDFAEPLATLLMIGAVTFAYRARRPDGAWNAQGLVAAGLAAAFAAAAKYTALWFLPLLALQVVLTTLASVPPQASLAPRLSRRVIAAAWALMALLGLPIALLAFAVLATGRLPTIWTGWSIGLAQGWLDFPVWAGLYGLLVSPGKGLLFFAPVVLLSAAGAASFVRRHRWDAFLFFGVPAVYLLVYGSKGVWHGGGWGPRYLVPALPFLACLALPIAERLLRPGSPVRLARAAAAILVAASVVIQLLGVAKHPNLYTVMFRDHVQPGLPEYGRGFGGPPADAYWRHFGGPDADRQLQRPREGVDPSLPQRGLGYRYAEEGPLRLMLDVTRPSRFALTIYVCDWDHRGRRQLITVDWPGGRADAQLDSDFSACVYRRWGISTDQARTITLTTTAASAEAGVTAHADVPVISAMFFDTWDGEPLDGSPTVAPAAGDWVGRFGRDGHVLFAWNRGQDVASLPGYIGGYDGGDSTWVDTWQTELAETAILYAPGFSPLLAHAWLLGADAVSLLRTSDQVFLQRALGAPPWRYVHGVESHSPRPEFGLGLDLWPLLLRSHFRSHPQFMAGVWLATAALVAGLAGSLLWLASVLRARSAA